MFIDELCNEKIIINNFVEPIVLNSISILITLIIIYFIFNYIMKSDNKVKILLIMFLIIFLIIILINEKLKTNNNFTKIIQNYNNISDELNTGDFVLFRYYNNTDYFTTCFYKIFLPFFQKTYFTHVGMIYKDEHGKNYILESSGLYYYCNLTNVVKNGTMLLNFNDRIENISNNRVHVVKNNLHKYIDKKKLNESILKYKNYTYLQDDLYCVNYITTLLEENGLFKCNDMLPITPEKILSPEYYNFDIKFEEPIIIKNNIK